MFRADFAVFWLGEMEYVIKEKCPIHAFCQSTCRHKIAFRIIEFLSVRSRFPRSNPSYFYHCSPIIVLWLSRLEKENVPKEYEIKEILIRRCTKTNETEVTHTRIDRQVDLDVGDFFQKITSVWIGEKMIMLRGVNGMKQDHADLLENKCVEYSSSKYRRNLSEFFLYLTSELADTATKKREEISWDLVGWSCE